MPTRPRLLRHLIVAATILTLGWGAWGGASGAAPEPAARVIVKFKADSPLMRQANALAASKAALGPWQTAAQARADHLSKRVGGVLKAGRLIAPDQQVLTAQGMTSSELARRLSAQSDVAYAVVDGRQRRNAAPNDPLYAGGAGVSPTSGQWYLRADASTPSAINAEGAWTITTGSSSVVVAVLDTGVRFDHPDLGRVANGGNFLDGYDFIHDALTANDGDGMDADASDAGDYVTQADVDNTATGCAASDIGNSSWHGTETASLIGALTNNGQGMASVGRTVRILSLRVLGKCGGYDSDIQAAMRWSVGLSVPGVPANTNKARILNLSLGSSGTCSAAYQQTVADVTAAGGLVVVSAGNSAGHAAGTLANCPGAMGVSGLRHIGTKVGFSDLGPEIAISAPGGNCVNTTGGCLYPILAATNKGTQQPVVGVAGAGYSDGVNISVGTSFSAPLVSGVAALMLAANPGLSVEQLRSVLQKTARPFPSAGAGGTVTACAAPKPAGEAQVDQGECYCTTSTCGAGMLDATAAVRAVAGTQARITLLTAAPTAASPVNFNAATSVVGEGRRITAHLWSVTDGGGIVTQPSSGADSSSFSITPTGAGRFALSLRITDDLGLTATTNLAVDVAAAPAPPPTPTPTPSPSPGPSGGGGGAVHGAWWWSLLALAALALRRHRGAR